MYVRLKEDSLKISNFYPQTPPASSLLCRENYNYMKKLFFLAMLMSGLSGYAQFHSLSMPQQSPEAGLRRQVGVTFVDIHYHSPAVRGRDVWNNTWVIPQKGNPIPWRAGANENTTFSFDTDVLIEGKPLKAGSYGFHVIPNGHAHSLLFVQPDNLWGSYYVDMDKDVVLRVEVEDTVSSFEEYLRYAVLEQGRDYCTFALQWGDRMIPFTVQVDLAKTAVDKWRYELNGKNTYRWRAWNDAALWCVRNHTNLEEALIWANRSLEGGYGGFAGHYSFENLSTKVEILDALGHEEALKEILEGLPGQRFSADDAHYMGASLLRIKRDKAAVELMKAGLKQHKGDFGMELYLGIAQYYLDHKKEALAALDACSSHCPENFKPRVAAIQNRMQDGTFEFLQRNP